MNGSETFTAASSAAVPALPLRRRVGRAWQTRAPGRSWFWPSLTTLSPAVSPFATIAVSPSMRSIVTGRITARASSPTT